MSIPGYGNMEVLASTNRMSAITFLSLYCSGKYYSSGTLVMYCITFIFLLLFLVPFRVQLVNILRKLLCFNIFTGIFVNIFCIWNIISGLYWVAHQCGHSQAPVLKLKRDKCQLNQQPLQSALPLIDEYLVGIQIRQTLVIDDNSSPLAPLTIEKLERKETFQMMKQPEYIADTIPEGQTLVSQVTPLLGTIPSENSQIQHRNTPEDILDILGTRVYQGYVETLLQTSDGIIVNQPRWFLPLTEEAKQIAEEIRIEKINEQWAGIHHEQLLNQSFSDQLNSIQILEQLPPPLQLAKEHLPGDIIDILERLGKADNIPFNQLYYIAENCTDHYYNKVIETFVTILKHQFADRQLLLVNTAQSLKFLEEYVDRQAQIWKIFQKHQMIPDDIQDLHFHIDNFKNGIEKEFAFLKEATQKNVENFQSSLNLQQMYSASLCSHVNDIYNKLAEIQWQIQHHDPHMNFGDTIQIEAPDFDPDIDEVLPTTMDKETNDPVTQGSATLTLKSAEKVIERTTPAPLHQNIDTQEVDWPDAIPVEILPQPNQQNEQSITIQPTRHNPEPAEIPQLEENLEEEKCQDLETYLTHHNTFKASQCIHRDYRSTLLALDDEKYYQEVDREYHTYGTLAAQDHRLANQTPGPHRTTQELIQIFDKGRGQACREELHGHRPFGARMRSLQSHIQQKIRKTQQMRQGYANAQ